MHGQHDAGRYCRRLAISIGLACVASLAWSAAASARCGDAPGDEAAKAVVRAAIETQCPCAGAIDKGSYVRCAKSVIDQAKNDGTLPRACVSAVKKCVKKSTCGRAGAVTCCRTTASGKLKCAVKKSAEKCRAPSGGTAVIGACPSCCEACTTGCAPSTPGATNTATVTVPPGSTNTATAPPGATNTKTPPPGATNTATALGTFTGTATATAVGTVSATITFTSSTFTTSPTPTSTPPPPSTATPTITATPTLPAICQSVVGLPPLAQLPVTLLQGSSQCGGAMLTNPPPAPPFAGSVADGSNTKLADLSLGCLYAGGLPPLLLPYGSSTEVSVVGLQLLPLALTLGASEGSGPADCTLGAGPGRSCANGAPGLDGSGTCNFDGDCGGQATSCALDANCFFGPPIPVPNGSLSACVMNAFLTDLCGQVTLVPPAATFAAALSSRVYLTFNADSPCPRCEAGVCTAGERAGLACSPIGSAGTSPDCPPTASNFLSTLTVVIPALTSGQSTLTSSDGFFCAGQPAPGAMGLTAARRVTEQGSGPTLPLLSTSLSMNVAGTFCIESTGTFLDAIAGLPAVGALSTGASVDIADVLF